MQWNSKPLKEWVDTASNKETPASVLHDVMVKSNFHYLVREALAENPNTPVLILEQLSNDPYSWVRKRVARNRKTPKYLIRRLLKDEDPSVVWESTYTALVDFTCATGVRVPGVC